MKRLFLFILFSVSIATTATETAHSSQQVLTRTFSNVLSYISDNKRIIEAWETMAPVLEADAELGAAFFEAYAPLFESYKIEVTGAWKAAIRKFLSNLDQSTHIGRNLTEKEQDAFTRFNNYWLKTFEVEQQQKAWRKIIRSTAGVAIIAAAALYYFGYFNTKGKTVASEQTAPLETQQPTHPESSNGSSDGQNDKDFNDDDIKQASPELFDLLGE